MTGRGTRTVAAALGAVLATTTFVGPVLAAPAAEVKGRILQIESTPGQVQVLFTGIGLAQGQQIDPGSVRVSLDGAELATTAEAVDSAASAELRRTAVLVIDTSGSMRGARLQGAKQAAAAFLSSVPADVLVGLVTFSSAARLDVAPTADRNAVRSRVAALVASGDTALYDATILALRTAGTAGARSIVLLTDGVDEGSKAQLPAVVAAARSSKVPISAVALAGTGEAGGPLAQVVATTKGTLLEAARTSDLARAFQTAARDISGQVLVRAPLPQDFAGTSGTIQVNATAGGVGIADSAFTTLRAVPAEVRLEDALARPADVSVEPWETRNALFVALGALFLALAVLMGRALAVTGLGGTRTRMSSRLSVYTLTGRGQPKAEPQATALGDNAVARSAVEFAGRLVGRRNFEERLATLLDAGGVPLKPAEWVLAHVGTALGTSLLFLLASGGGLLPAAVGLLLGAAVPVVYLRFKESRRKSAFLAQLPETLQLLAGGLSAGYSFPQALDSVARESGQPVSGEFGRALVESRLGVPVETALDGIAERMKSVDFAWVIMAVRIQREVGGNLAEVLNTVANTLRERERLRRQVQVLSAEGRLSAWILGGLPPVFGVYLLLVRRDYISPLYTDPLGIVMLVTMIVLITVGALWLRKVVKVEV